MSGDSELRAAQNGPSEEIEASQDGQLELVAKTTAGFSGNRDTEVVADESRYIPRLSATAEINQLGRALFLHAGSAIDRCTFDDVLIDIGEEEQCDSTKPEEHSAEDGSGSHEQLYSPLTAPRSLRILTVEPGNQDEPLRTSLCIRSLDDDQLDFEAISYCWGDPSDKALLTSNQTNVSVPNNLLDALRQIRSPSRRKTVWADAVCINQDDVEERGQQVAIMRHIFRRATRVLVWLGRDSENIATSAFDLTCKIAKQFEPSGDPYLWGTYESLTDPVKELGDALSSVESETWEHLRSMFDLAWFKRVWVVQEVNVAQSVVVLWGDHHIAWPLIGLCASWLVTQGWYAMEHKGIPQAYNAFLQYAILPLSGQSTLTSFGELGLSIILEVMRGAFDATDARDRVYGLLGLRFKGNDAQHDKLILQPDYTMDLKEVYIDAAKNILQHDGNLRMLTTVQHGLEIDEQWPSWVPRWDQTYAVPIGVGDERGFYANAGELFDTTNSADELFGSDGLSLRVTGLRRQTIAEVSDEVTWRDVRPDGLGAFSDALASILRDMTDPANMYRFQPSDHTERHTIFGYVDREYLDKNPRWYEQSFCSNCSWTPGKYYQRDFFEMHQADTLCGFALYWRARSSWPELEFFGPLMDGCRAQGMPPDEVENLFSAYNVLLRRRIFRCDDGSFGLGPAACRPGDSVVVLFGGTVPFVLRPRGEEAELSTNDDANPSVAPSSWAFVGECFKPEIMKGEAVTALGLPGITYDVSDDGHLRLQQDEPMSSNSADKRHSRKVGEYGVERFILR